MLLESDQLLFKDCEWGRPQVPHTTPMTSIYSLNFGRSPHIYVKREEYWLWGEPSTFYTDFFFILDRHSITFCYLFGLSNYLILLAWVQCKWLLILSTFIILWFISSFGYYGSLLMLIHYFYNPLNWLSWVVEQVSSFTRPREMLTIKDQVVLTVYRGWLLRLLHF